MSTPTTKPTATKKATVKKTIAKPKQAEPDFTFLDSLDIIQKDRNYEVKKIGFMQLKRSLIPSEIAQRVVFHQDNATSTEMAIIATKMNLTPDELQRRINWTFLKTCKDYFKD